jgi:hypothetical protein
VLKATGSEDPKYPHPFDLHVKVQLQDNTLTQELAVTNTGQELGPVSRAQQLQIDKCVTQAGLQRQEAARAYRTLLSLL